MKYFGIDIGGSHISGVEVRLSTLDPIFSSLEEMPLDTSASLENLLNDWVAFLFRLIKEERDIKIGIAIPGPFDYKNGISLIKQQGKMRAMYGLSVKNLLAERLSISSDQIEFVNDAEAFLKGESFSGSAVGFQNAMGLTLGTGLGSAIKLGESINDAKLWTAPFREGIAEDYLGTGWFIKKAKENFSMEITGVKDLFSIAINPSIGMLLFEEFGESLGEFLLPYLTRFKLDGIVIGGKISLAASHFLPSTKAYLEKNACLAEINISKLGEYSALVGACLPFKYLSATKPNDHEV